MAPQGNMQGVDRNIISSLDTPLNQIANQETAQAAARVVLQRAKTNGVTYQQATQLIEETFGSGGTGGGATQNQNR